jgi:hypothetical protein
VTMLLPMLRAYMVVSDDMLAQQLGALTQIYTGTTGYMTANVQRIDGETIDGVRTEGYEIRAGDELFARGWTAPEFRGAVRVAPTPGDPMASLSERGLPMRTRVIMKTQGPLTGLYGEGYLYMSTDVISVEKTEVEDERFEIPAGYARMEMGGARSPSNVAPPVVQ